MSCLGNGVCYCSREVAVVVVGARPVLLAVVCLRDVLGVGKELKPVYYYALCSVVLCFRSNLGTDLSLRLEFGIDLADFLSMVVSAVIACCPFPFP